MTVAGSPEPSVGRGPDLGVVPPLAWRPVLGAMAAVAVLLSALSEGYGFHRDELYFRMLPAAWGYLDQPPLTPWLGRTAASLSPDPWVMRIPATAGVVLSVLVVVAITRELGGGRGAQTWCAWSYAFASTPLLFGHVFLTASLDLVFWPATCLFLLRAVVRRRPQWWLAVGATLGVCTYNKLLIVLLVVALGVGILAVGPRRALWSRWVLAGAVLGGVIALPNLIYQATHFWPQVSMGRALSENNASDVRVMMWPFLALLLGPPLVPVWIAGLVALLRRPQWRAVRFLAVAFGVLLAETFVGGGQFYYPVGLLVVIFAARCVPTAHFLARSAAWRRAAAVLVSINAVVSAVIALPVLPLSALAVSPVPSINQLARDQVGWPAYVAQVAAVYRSVPAAERAHTVVVATNYGEAGAIVRYGPALGLPRPYSGHNQLYFDARPPADASTVVLIGAQADRLRTSLARSTVRAHLHDESGVDNEEVGQPVALCQQPVAAWSTLWPRFRHED